ILDDAASRRSRLTPLRTTDAPARARPTAIAWPRPREEPVMRAVLPFRLNRSSDIHFPQLPARRPGRARRDRTVNLPDMAVLDPDRRYLRYIIPGEDSLRNRIAHKFGGCVCGLGLDELGERTDARR